MTDFVSIIPARIGSKGIVKKNLYPLNGKPLIQWTVESSLGSDYVSETVVSSDSDEILNFNNILSYKKHKRRHDLSNDTARSEDVILNVLNEMNHLKDYEYLILLQPTSPLRTSQHINLACKKIIETNADSLLSVKEIPNEILKVLIEDSKGNLKSGFNKEFPFMPRQELPNAYLPNGAIYISKVSSFIKSHSLLATKNTFMIMDDDSSNDIDNLDDIITTESIFKKNEYKKKSKPA